MDTRALLKMSKPKCVVVVDAVVSHENMEMGFIPWFAAVAVLTEPGENTKTLRTFEGFMKRPYKDVVWSDEKLEFWNNEKRRSTYEYILRQINHRECPRPEDMISKFVSWARELAREFDPILVMPSTLELCYLTKYVNMYVPSLMGNLTTLFGERKTVIEKRSWMYGITHGSIHDLFDIGHVIHTTAHLKTREVHKVQYDVDPLKASTFEAYSVAEMIKAAESMKEL